MRVCGDLRNSRHPRTGTSVRVLAVVVASGEYEIVDGIGGGRGTFHCWPQLSGGGGCRHERCLDVRLKGGASASESLVAFVEDRGGGLEDVGDVGGYVQDDGDVVG